MNLWPGDKKRKVKVEIIIDISYQELTNFNTVKKDELLHELE